MNNHSSQSIILFAYISYKEIRATVMGISHTVTGFCRVLVSECMLILIL